MITEAIKEILVKELNYTFGSDLFIGREPAQPNNCTTLYDAPGSGPDLTLNRLERYDRFSFQARIRDTSYVNAFLQADDIVDCLQGRSNLEVDDYYITLIRTLTSPHLLEWDENDRVIVVCNFDVQAVKQAVSES